MSAMPALPTDIIKSYLSFPRRDEFIPVSVDDGCLLVCLLSERAAPQADYLAWMNGMEIKTEVLPDDDFYALLESAHSLWAEEDDDSRSPEEKAAQIDDVENSLLGWSHDDAPIVRLVNKILRRAISDGASDVHFEMHESGFLVRCRLDGELKAVRTLDKGLHPAVVARLKVMGEMDVAESRVPQDGRIMVRVGQKGVDVRVSTVPTLRGEKAVLRILDRSRTILSLPDLGLKPEAVAMLRQAISAPYGIILVTGPTGSGKTTTLYAALAELVHRTGNIMTVEDPVEYHLDGVNQVQVNRLAGVTFASAVRAFLRQDPDVILVGEIRDQETASVAIQASLTGHLVLSTLHTNDAPTAVNRLIDMEVEPFLLASSLNLVIAQRLVRLNCPYCLKEVRIDPVALRAAIPVDIALTTQKKGMGCEHCSGSGHSGRRAIFEMLPVDEEIRGLITRKVSSDVIRRYAHEKGFQTMFDQGLELIGQGRLTFEELLRVTGT